MYYQSRNTLVRLTHIPTGITVQSGEDRATHRNMANCKSVLRARLWALQNGLQPSSEVVAHYDLPDDSRHPYELDPHKTKP